MNTGNNKHLEAFKNMHLLHPLLHLHYTVLTLIITVLMHPILHFVRLSFCGIFSVFDLWHFVLWHFVRDSYKLYSL